MTFSGPRAEWLTELKPRIVIFGIGGAGGNAVNNMIDAGLGGVEFVVANTDAQQLQHAKTDRRIQLGASHHPGPGAGAHLGSGHVRRGRGPKPRSTNISKASHMVFITAGMGGGTGTRGAPVIAKRGPRERGILTVGVDHLPSPSKAATGCAWPTPASRNCSASSTP